MNQLIEFLKENQLLTTLLGVSGAGMLTFWVKDVPRRIIAFFIRNFTTTITVNNTSKFYNFILKWIQVNYKNTNFRHLKIISANKIGGTSDSEIQIFEKNANISIGYGTHFIFFKHKLIKINLIKDASNQTSADKEYVVITKFGRSKKLFDLLFNEIENFTHADESKNELYSLGRYEWNYCKKYFQRSIDSIFLEKQKIESLLDRLTNFNNSEQWFLNTGIPYQLGVLFYGPPGTGKSSIIRAMATYLNLPIYFVQTNKLDLLEEGMLILEEKCIIVIEDIDTNLLTHSRESKEENDYNDNPKFSLSSILNTLDGLFSPHGRILFATTNHIEKLDPALLRPGRFDMKIEIGYVNNEILSQFIAKFFPDKNNNLSDLIIKDKITVAMLQEYVLSGHTFEEILEEISVKKSLDLNKINQKCSLDKSISSELALSDVTPINWSKDVMGGKKKVVIDN